MKLTTLRPFRAEAVKAVGAQARNLNRSTVFGAQSPRGNRVSMAYIGVPFHGFASR